MAGNACSSSLLAQTTLPNGAYISNTYDTHGRVPTNCLFNSSGIALDCYNYTYDVGNQRTTVRRNNENSVGYTYDAIGQVLADQASEVSGGFARLNEQLYYAFDPVGNLAYRTNNALVENFRFNTVNEITNNTNGGTLTVLGTTTSSATSVAVNGTTAAMYGDYTFAAAGLPLTSSYTATASDSLGRHSTNTVSVNVATNVSFHYDGNGNLTNDGLRNFVYDDENELVQVSVSNAWMSQFQYDGKMRRRIRKEFTWQGGAWLQTNAVYYIYDGNLVIQERDANNMPMVTYTRGNDLSGTQQGDGGVGGLLARTSAPYTGAALSGQAYYHSDANGNVTMLIDDYQGVVAKYLYDAFGNVLAKSGMLADANVYRFSSKEWHQNSGLVYYLYRYYDPHLQRWPTRDPLGDEGFTTFHDKIDLRLDIPYFKVSAQPDLYSFVENRALNDIDVFGLVDYAELLKMINKQNDLINFLEGRGFPEKAEAAGRELDRLEMIWRRFCRDFPDGGSPASDIIPAPTPCPTKKPLPPLPPGNIYNHDAPPVNWWPWLKWVTPFLIPWPGNPVYGFV